MGPADAQGVPYDAAAASQTGAASSKALQAIARARAPATRPARRRAASQRSGSAKMAAAVQQAPYLGPSSSTNEWIETQAEDERFLPTFQDDASLITEGLWLGSESNVRDLAWVKVEKIQRIVTIMPYEVDPTDGGNVSESLKDWFRQNVTTLFLDARDTPTQLV